MEDILTRLERETYAVEHNPNCPSPYLIRLVGLNGCIDKKPVDETGDILGYGQTLTEAYEAALAGEKSSFHRRIKLRGLAA